jgi:hypothetical protein
LRIGARNKHNHFSLRKATLYGLSRYSTICGY